MLSCRAVALPSNEQIVSIHQPLSSFNSSGECATLIMPALAELQSIWLVSWGGGGGGPHPLPTPPPQWAVKSSAFLLSFLTVSCEEFYILACSLFTLDRCGKTLYCSVSILRPQGFGSFWRTFHDFHVFDAWICGSVAKTLSMSTSCLGYYSGFMLRIAYGQSVGQYSLHINVYYFLIE